jgi:large subunit ribosomal protein L30
MAKIQIKQVKSRIGRPERQKRTLDALGLRKLNHQVVLEDTPDVMGMVNAVRHLVVVTKVEE